MPLGRKQETVANTLKNCGDLNYDNLREQILRSPINFYERVNIDNWLPEVIQELLLAKVIYGIERRDEIIYISNPKMH